MPNHGVVCVAGDVPALSSTAVEKIVVPPGRSPSILMQHNVSNEQEDLCARQQSGAPPLRPPRYFFPMRYTSQTLGGPNPGWNRPSGPQNI